MAYIHPQHVLSPRKNVGGVVEVIHDPGPREMAVARIIWNNEEVVAVRWNGDDRKPLGNPVSTGQPTWFVVAGYAAEDVERAARIAAEKSPASLAAQYREMAADEQREREAEEWIEGFINDGDDQKG